MLTGYCRILAINISIESHRICSPERCHEDKLNIIPLPYLLDIIIAMNIDKQF